MIRSSPLRQGPGGPRRSDIRPFRLCLRWNRRGKLPWKRGYRIICSGNSISESRRGGRVVEFRVLGELEVIRDGARAMLPPSRKTRALLAYLALTRHRHRRERLCEIFWDVPDDPRGSLRW